MKRKSRDIFPVIFLMGIVMSIILYSQAPDYQSIYLNGVELGRKGKFEEAKKEIEKALKINPMYIPAKRAMDLFEDIKKGTAKTITARHLFDGMRFFAVQKWKEAGVGYKKAFENQPDYYFAIHNYASALLQSQENAEVISLYKKVLGLKPDYPYSHYNLGIAYDDKGMFEKAIESYKHAIRLAPWYYKAYNNIAASLWSMGKKSETPYWYLESVKAYPAYRRGFDNLMESVYENLHFINKLIPIYKNTCGKEPAKINVCERLGTILWKTGKWKDAGELIEQFERACAEKKNETK